MAPARAHERVRRVRRAMEEVPDAQEALLSLDDQQALAAEDEEVLLVGLAVVHRARLAGLEHVEPDPELWVLLDVQLWSLLNDTPVCLESSARRTRRGAAKPRRVR